MSSRHSRRSFIRMMGAAGWAGLIPAPLAFARGPSEQKLMVVVLRGALDGLGAVIPYRESRLYDLRRKLVPPKPGEKGGALPLGSEGFALHPALGGMHASWREGQLAILHAASSPYRERSHFDGQDVLESGGVEVLASRDGWLNRALQHTDGIEAAAVAGALPLLLRGDAHAVTWAPSILPEPDDDTLGRLMHMYQDDEPLHAALQDAQALDRAAGGIEGDARGVARGRSYEPLMQAGANLVASGAAGVVVLSLGGWDTHRNQGAQGGALAARLGQLDRGLAAVRETLGDMWSRTAVLVVTEFGRTVRVNGSLGTDHGTGGAALLVGGAVKGGRILGDWPGLAPSALFEDRDLYPANDLRGLFKGVLRDHLGVSRGDLDRYVFPGSKAVAPLSGLV
ncbi:MAG: DUF1501 domain-containing protein [Gammaproteobacteria bacterium]|nr:DUF1501 domain-containing protein [Gammaproteobacteria bacterium]MBT8055614.1 DUF1501 domain-containing protein [Gammaproteobacteria bacterium]